jgi:hypothetical protein
LYHSILGFIPGGHISQELAEYKGRIQQERLNRFTELLKEQFEKITNKQLDPENLKSEDFVDTFEIIIRKVVQTKSQEKIRRYSNILLKQMFQKNEAELFSKYVSIVDETTDTQILILMTLQRIDLPLSEYNIIEELAKQSCTINKAGDIMAIILDKKDIPISKNAVVSRSELTFHLFDLRKQGLIEVPTSDVIHDDIINENQNIEEYRLSLIGQSFLNFISEYGNL